MFIGVLLISAANSRGREGVDGVSMTDASAAWKQSRTNRTSWVTSDNRDIPGADSSQMIKPVTSVRERGCQFFLDLDREVRVGIYEETT
jgi:hypothetical protein